MQPCGPRVIRPVATSYLAPCHGQTKQPSRSIDPFARSAPRWRQRRVTANSSPSAFPTAYRPAPRTTPGTSSAAGPTSTSRAIASSYGKLSVHRSQPMLSRARARDRLWARVGAALEAITAGDQPGRARAPQARRSGLDRGCRRSGDLLRVPRQRVSLDRAAHVISSSGTRHRSTQSTGSACPSPCRQVRMRHATVSSFLTGMGTTLTTRSADLRKWSTQGDSNPCRTLRAGDNRRWLSLK